MSTRENSADDGAGSQRALPEVQGNLSQSTDSSRT